MARRAWLVLEEARGRQEPDLAAASGLRSSVVQAIVRGYRHQGLIALVDAPRVGRPRKTEPERALLDAKKESASAAAAEHAVSPDSVWRYARLQGATLERSMGKNPLVLSAEQLTSVASIYADDNVALLILSGEHINDAETRAVGYLHITARHDCDEPPLPLAAGWFAELTNLRSREGHCTPRARREAGEWFAARAARLPITLGPYTALLAGDPCSPQFLHWLTAIRRLQSSAPSTWATPAAHAAGSPEDWDSLLLTHGIAAPSLQALTWPTTSSLPMVWCVAIRPGG
jgi:transposase